MKKNIISFCVAVFVVCLGFLCSCSVTKENYDEKRDELVKANDYKVNVDITENDKKVDEKLQNLKNDYKNSELEKNRYNMDFLRNSNIWNSQLYQFCKQVPKGGDLHLHDMAILPAAETLDFFKDRENVYVCCNRDSKDWCNLSIEKKNVSHPEDYINLKQALQTGKVNNEDLYKKWSLLSYNKQSEHSDVWTDFEDYFDEQIFDYSDSKVNYDYHYRAFEYYYNNNIQHIELKVLLSGSKEEAESVVCTIKDAYRDFKSTHPDFTLKLIGCVTKLPSIDKNFAVNLMENALYIYDNVEDEFDTSDNNKFLVALDYVNEEDESKSLKDFKDDIFKVKAEHPGIELYFHAGESLMMSIDNIYDAYLYGCKRIGHCFNLYRYPDLMDRVKHANICLEVCPVSNQVLEYAQDLRQHPAVEYMKREMSVVLCSDDPAIQEHTSLVDDYFAGIICWDLSIAEVKQLSYNAINYSSLSKDQKTQAMKDWNDRWNDFINSQL